jgi:3-hydroxyacyl-CoA dehydrogenase/enoyl-CoA hydratase/3-hydroxybutyryl-CoA epimerase
MSDAFNFTHQVDADGVLRIIFDTPGQKVNLLSEDMLRALDRLLEETRNREEIRAVLFTSAKRGMFIAGMDVEQIASVNDAYRGAEAARFGQAVFQKIANLERPSACAINGTCLGGGTELALACSFRVAADRVDLRIGLPEVKLGIIPGFGGTQRLPRLVGVIPSLDLILTGRTLDARRALRIGLVDKVAPEAYVERQALGLLRDALTEGEPAVRRRLRRKPKLIPRLIRAISPLRRKVLEQARKKTEAKASPENYPAPFRAIEAIEAACAQDLPQGLDFEARLLGELIPTRTSKNLIWLFKSQTALKNDTGDVRATPRKIQRAAVLGAGIMGGGIAQLIADREIPVRLKDLNYDAVLTALATANGVWQRKLERRRIDKRELNQKMAFIAPTLDATGLTKVDIVLEAVVEDLEIKRRVLADTEQRIGERTVFATNTSSLPISDIAAGGLHPERVVGLHFFNPVDRMPLVEIIAGERSSPEAVATAHAFAIKLGKTPVIVKDGPGFLVNRILTFYLNEALQMLVEGVRMEALDDAMEKFGMPMGPFALLDQVGLDTAGHVAGVLRAAFGERAGATVDVLETVTGSGRLGRKNGLGFYLYRSGKRRGPDGEIYNLIGVRESREVPAETLQERMVLAMVNEAVLCLEEGVVAQPRDIDVAMVMGTGFPPFRGGLLRYADEIGVPVVADRLSRLADAHGGRFRPAKLFSEMVRQQRHFYGPWRQDDAAGPLFRGQQ